MNAIIRTLFIAALTAAMMLKSAAAETSAAFFPFCIDWHDAKKRTFEQQATMLKELGYDGVGHIWLDKVADRLKSLDDAGLKLFQITMTVEVGPDKEPFDARFKETLQLVNGRRVQFCLLVNGMKPSDAAVDPRAVEILRAMSELAKGTDAQLLLYPHQGSWIERIEDATRVADKVDRPNVGVMFNVCHWLRVDKSRDYKSLLKQAMPRLWAVSINGADNFDEAQGWSRYIQPLDAGSFDVATFLRDLRELGYKGPVGLQCYGIGGDARDHLARSMAAWRKISADRTETLWQIGKPDRDTREFALAPGNYSQFKADGFFVVGKSDPKQDWPYVHPGPIDGWAGGSPHIFTILFGLKEAQASGACKLVIDLADSHGHSAPNLRVEINGAPFARKIPNGAGDASVFGDPAKGKPHKVEVAFPAALLKNGANEIRIATSAGSWMLYDAVSLEAPRGHSLGEVTGSIFTSLRSPPTLVNRNGELNQTLQAIVHHMGDSVEARFSLNDKKDAPASLKRGSQTIELAIPAVTNATTITVTLDVAGRPVGTQTLTLQPVRKWVVYLLPHSHVDIGYTHLQTEVERSQWRFIETAIETARKTAQYPAGARFKWNVEVLWAVDSYLQQATTEKREAFIEAVKAGHLGLDALYGNMLTGLCRPEEMLRMLRLAPELAKLTGAPVESAMITDVPGYTWGIVPTLAHSGVRYFSIAPNGTDRIGRTSAAWGDKPFWWIGPNGKDRLLVWMTGTGYYQVFQSEEKLLQYLGGLEAKNYPYDFVQLRHCLGDNGAPDVNFSETVRKWNEKHAYPKLVIATTAEMFRDFEKRYGDKIPEVKGDFTPYWEDGAASSARETALNRAAAERLIQAETLFAMFDPEAYPLMDFYRAWRNTVLYDEHTWGAHNSISAPDEPFVKNQWAIKQAFALDADSQSKALLAKAIELRGGAGAKVESVDIFNTLSWTRTDLAILPKEWALAGELVTGPNDEPVYAQRLTNGDFAFLASDIPPFGAKRFSFHTGKPLSPGSAHAKGRSLTTSTLSVSIDETTGAISSLRSIRLDRELAQSGSGSSLNDYFYLPGVDLKNLKRNGPVRISVKETGPLVASLLIESDAPGCRKLTREVRLTEGLDRVDIINTVDKLPIRSKEGVHFGFGFNVPNGVVRTDVPWAVVRAEADQMPGACKNWFTVQRWIDISNDEYGATWATPDAPLAQVGGITANILGAANDPTLWRDKVEPTQEIYSWAMNNHWHTNYRADQEGPTVFRYSIAPHGKFSSDEAARFGTSLTQPLIAIAVQGAPPYGEPPVRVDSSGVLVTALKPSDDGKALIVRLFGASGKPESVRLQWHSPVPREVSLSDNGERAGRSVPNIIDVPPFGIVTLRAELHKN